jgi:hypothetical protein
MQQKTKLSDEQEINRQTQDFKEAETLRRTFHKQKDRQDIEE